jgi:hypothetical protein
MSCEFTNLYKVFFLNDFINLKVFSRKVPDCGTRLAIYRGVVDGSPVATSHPGLAG